MKSIINISLLLNIHFPRHFILFPLHVLPKRYWIHTHSSRKTCLKIYQNLIIFTSHTTNKRFFNLTIVVAEAGKFTKHPLAFVYPLYIVSDVIELLCVHRLSYTDG